MQLQNGSHKIINQLCFSYFNSFSNTQFSYQISTVSVELLQIKIHLVIFNLVCRWKMLKWHKRTVDRLFPSINGVFHRKEKVAARHLKFFLSIVIILYFIIPLFEMHKRVLWRSRKHKMLEWKLQRFFQRIYPQASFR